MSTRRPLVLVEGLPAQLPFGDQLPADAAGLSLLSWQTATNGSEQIALAALLPADSQLVDLCVTARSRALLCPGAGDGASTPSSAPIVAVNDDLDIRVRAALRWRSMPAAYRLFAKGAAGEAWSFGATADGRLSVILNGTAQADSWYHSLGDNQTAWVRFTRTRHARLTTALAGANNDLAFTSLLDHAAGEATTVAYILPTTPWQGLSVTVAGAAISVNLATDAGTSQVETATAAGTITVGVWQVETATAAGTITASGNATVVVTGAAISGSPITLSVAVTSGDTAATWAGKVATALLANAAITALYSVGVGGTAISLTARAPAANDSTLNLSLDNGTCTGITTAATSANTTAGVASGAGNATVVVTGAGISGSPITLSVAVADGDTAAIWVGKVYTALAANAAITALYSVGVGGTAISLTALAPAANDSTLNLSLDNGTCTGITTAATSANTTTGVAPTITSTARQVRDALRSDAAVAALVSVALAPVDDGSGLVTALAATNLALGTGTLRYWTSGDGIIWSQVGGDFDCDDTAIASTADAVVVAEPASGVPPGIFLSAELRGAVDSTPVLIFDAGAQTIGATSWSSASGTAETWTLAGVAAVGDQAIAPRANVSLGTGSGRQDIVAAGTLNACPQRLPLALPFTPGGDLWVNSDTADPLYFTLLFSPAPA